MRGCRFQCLLALLAVLVLSSGMAAGLKGSSKGRKKGRKASERGAFVLERLSQTYLPSYYSAGEPKFCLGSGAAEQVAYDGKEKVIYVVGYKVRREGLMGDGVWGFSSSLRESGMRSDFISVQGNS